MNSSASPRTAASILSRFDASAEAKALLVPDAEAPDCVALLVEKELWTDATGFVAQWLPPHDAVALAPEGHGQVRADEAAAAGDENPRHDARMLGQDGASWQARRCRRV
mgnify:CR=1 FL=1